MNRPPHPRMMNNTFRSPRPYHNQWKPNRAPFSPFPWRGNSQFQPDNNLRNESSAEHWCETCDRGFPTVELLHKHKQQHQKCNIDGCQFVAHPKVITKHIQMQHSTGLYKKIANLNNPEEIQRWRDERKKKYPTKSNIEKKAAEYKEKIERGEKMALKHGHGDHSRKSIDHGSGNKRKHCFDKMNHNQRMNRYSFKPNSSISINDNHFKPPKKIPKILPSAPTTTEKNKLRPFTGILNIEMNDEAEAEDITETSNNGLFENDDYEEILEVPKKIKDEEKPVVCGALTSLMCDYGSSDEETNEKENKVCNKSLVATQQEPVEPFRGDSKKVESANVTKPTIVVKDGNDSDDGPEEVKIVKTNVEHENTQAVTKNKEKSVEKVKIPSRNLNHQNHKVKRKIPSTLLQKLLHNEIRQERNIVLQCIRYIRINNYFVKSNQ